MLWRLKMCYFFFVVEKAEFDFFLTSNFYYFGAREGNENANVAALNVNAGNNNNQFSRPLLLGVSGESFLLSFVLSPTSLSLSIEREKCFFLCKYTQTSIHGWGIMNRRQFIEVLARVLMTIWVKMKLELTS